MRHNTVLLLLNERKINDKLIDTLISIYVEIINVDMDTELKTKILENIRVGLGDELYKEIENEYKL